jgi:putative endonuclease
MTLERALRLSVEAEKKMSEAAVLCFKNEGTDRDEPEHILLGKTGEDIAVRFLSAKGYRVVERNVRYPWGEIDIVARDGDEVVFVEVRTRSIGRLLPPECSVGPDKLKKLKRAAGTWAESRHYDGFWRIDLIAITINEGRDPLVEHLKQITEGIT